MPETGSPDGGIEAPVLIYDRIAANKRQTWLMMLIFIALAGGFATLIALVLGLPWQAAPFIIAILAAYALFSYYASAGIALAVSSAHEVTKEQEPEYYRIVENLCIGSGLPMPKVYVIEDSAPNAFATGRDPQHAAVTATRGLLNKLDKSELEGVIAHEMSHIGNYDIRLMTITVVLVGLVALLADFFMRWTWFGSGSRRSNEDRDNNLQIVLLVVAILFAILALQMGFVTRAQFVEGAAAWMGGEARDLGRTLVEKGFLKDYQHEAVEVAIRAHIRTHGDDAKALASITVPWDTLLISVALYIVVPVIVSQV